MKTVGAFDAKTHLSQYLTEVQESHEEILIQRRGKNVAVLKAYEDVESRRNEAEAADILSAFREIRETEARYCTAEEIREMREEGRKS